jgi:hypothetical protein
MSASVAGKSAAAPTPWTTRAAIKARIDGAAAQAADAAVNTVTPTRNIRRNPTRSPSAPAVSKSPASVNVYAFSTH